jgi:mono/diheme cytochrome c family protein
MKTLLAAASVLLSVALAAACASAPTRSAAGGADAAGENLYREHCGACHRLRDPSEEVRERWAWAVDRYGPRAHLDEKDRALVLRHLQAHAKDAASAAPEAR